jgi:hypothetical protein
MVNLMLVTNYFEGKDFVVVSLEQRQKGWIVDLLADFDWILTPSCLGLVIKSW